MGKVVLLLTKMEDTASVTKFGNYQECSIEKLKFEMHFFFFFMLESYRELRKEFWLEI